MTDTSTKRAEELAAKHQSDAPFWGGQEGLFLRETASLLRVLAAERDALQKERDALKFAFETYCGQTKATITRATLEGKGNE
ncbi:MAG: hypothetical protein INH13_25795 [Cupriavidus sp.]|nr:hypothetical protein [Cupriavidus sp.]